LRNELVTAAEIMDGRIVAAPDMSALICESAAAEVSNLDVRALFPIGPRVGPAVGLLGLWTIGVWFVLRGQPIAVPMFPTAAPAIGIIDVRIEPPAYTKLAPSSTQNPGRIQAIEGSRLLLAISSSASSVALEQVVAGDPAATDTQAPPTQQALRQDARGHFSGEVIAQRDGYLAFQPRDAAGRPGVRRLLPVTVTPDRAPVVVFDKPGRDLLVTDLKKPIPLHVEAQDDIGLRALKVTYTKVSGSGETFMFTEGELPLTVASPTSTAWSGDGTLSLASLGLQAGDLIVYRALATDDRPGAAPAESDAFVVEVVRPGELLGDGFAVDDNPDRYKVSQQMVIVKTEQLIAKKAALSIDAFVDQAATIAAEQRKVRAEFVFMMGGELSEDDIALAEDPTQLHEDTEAMGEADLMAGRMKNQGRRDLIEAVRRMSDAATSLGVPDAPVALKQERAALDALQNAFSKSRYILRTIPIRERIDATRRMSGSLAGLVPWRRDGIDAAVAPRVAQIRRAIDELTAFGMRASFSAGDSSEVSRLSEALLRVDPRSSALQQAAARLDRAAADLAARRSVAQLRGWIDDAAVQLEKIATADLRDAPIADETPASARLNGALSDAIRAGGSIKRQP
jgi:hypothetical protein